MSPIPRTKGVMQKKNPDSFQSGIDWEKQNIQKKAELVCMAIPGAGIDQKKIKQLLEVVNEQDEIKLKVLYNGVISSLQAYQKDSTAANLKNWKSAEKSLKDFVATLSGLYIEAEKTFPNLLTVIKHLKDNGWKAGKSSIYEDKRKGKIKPREDGLFYLKDVEKYAFDHLKRLDGKKAGDLNEQLQEAKLRAEIKKTEAQAVHWEARAKASSEKYITLDFHNSEVAARASLFSTDLDNFFRSQAAGIVDLVGGNPDKIPDLIDFCLSEKEKMLARYSAEGQKFIAPATIPDPEGEAGNEEEEE
jgi:hypothetical protein